MKSTNNNESNPEPKEATESQKILPGLMKIPSRLVIKNIPSDLDDEEIKQIFLKKFKQDLKEEMMVVKLQKKYNPKKRNKILFMTVENFEVRQKVIEFIASFELVDPKGLKQKMTINDCLLQRKAKDIEDPIQNTLESCEHFLKFKEFLEKDKILDFKNEEEECKVYIKI